jgi:hypothetical protein
MSRALKATAPMDLTPEQRKERRALRREKLRLNNILRAAKMYKARLKSKAETPKAHPTLQESLLLAAPGGATGSGATRSIRRSIKRTGAAYRHR